ncbi:hypothetical protein ACT3S7_11225 [Corynebacterium sp. AOP34-AQ2-28]|uniref:hypothetical protein n=1 Tax=Corynebacterium sp. AOP34-AQ2-28 TaxID=3457689 RepID=UPI004033E36F
MNRSNRHRGNNALADSIAGFDDPSMGDERERDVILRAFTVGAIASTAVFFALGVFTAVIGGGFWSVPVILGSGVSGLVVANYCKREGVDYSQAMARVEPKRLMVSYIVSAAFLVAWLCALVFHQRTGHPLVDVGLGTSMDSSSGYAPLLGGAVTGFVVYIIANTISRYRKTKQARAEALRADDIEDDG